MAEAFNASDKALCCDLPEWAALKEHAKDVDKTHLKDLLQDAARVEALTAEHNGMYLDYSRQRVTSETMSKLFALAEATGLRGKIDAMFSGAHLNSTEDRAVLHVASRAPRSSQIVVDGKDVVPDVHAVLDKIADNASRMSGGADLGVAWLDDVAPSILTFFEERITLANFGNLGEVDTFVVSLHNEGVKRTMAAGSFEDWDGLPSKDDVHSVCELLISQARTAHATAEELRASREVAKRLLGDGPRAASSSASSSAPAAKDRATRTATATRGAEQQQEGETEAQGHEMDTEAKTKKAREAAFKLFRDYDNDVPGVFTDLLDGNCPEDLERLKQQFMESTKGVGLDDNSLNGVFDAFMTGQRRALAECRAMTQQQEALSASQSTALADSEASSAVRREVNTRRLTMREIHEQTRWCGICGKRDEAGSGCGFGGASIAPEFKTETKVVHAYTQR